MKKLITENPLNRIKLMMNYELGKTLNENKQNILEQADCANAISYEELIAYVKACENAIDSAQNWRMTVNLLGLTGDAKTIFDSLSACNNRNVYDDVTGQCSPALPMFIEKYKEVDSDDWGWGSTPLKSELAELLTFEMDMDAKRYIQKSLQILNSATMKKGDGKKQPPVTDSNGFPKCAQLKGKVVNGTITYQSSVWDKPSISLSSNGTYMVNSGKYKGKIGKYSCTQTGKVYLELPGATKIPVDDTIKKGLGKKTYKDCSSVNLDTTPLAFGCKDSRIAKVQGCLGITADGKFGPATRKALTDNAYDASKGITKAIFDKVVAGCSSTKTAGSNDGSLADVNYLRNPIKMDLGKVPDMPNKNSQGMSDAKYYQSLVAGGLIKKNLAGRIAYNGPVLEPEEKIKLDNQASTLGYIPTINDSATDKGARYVWKRK